MVKNILISIIFTTVSMVCSAETSVSGNRAASCAVAYHGKTHFIRLQGTNREIGRVEYNTANHWGNMYHLLISRFVFHMLTGGK